jgi:hypothetical protein
MHSVQNIVYTEPREVLEAELAKRIAKNPHYSLRSFARSLGISHSLLSLALSQKRRFSKRTVRQIGERLSLSPDQILQLEVRDQEIVDTQDFNHISLDTFATLSDWHHYAILSLLETPEAQLEARWIATRLGISSLEAGLAINRLKRLKLISKIDGKWKQTSAPLKVENAVSTTATRKHHTQLLGKALESLENDTFESRDFSSMTFAMHPKLVPYARKRIQKFRRQLVKDLEQMAKPTEVYELTVQVFPLTKMEKSK